MSQTQVLPQPITKIGLIFAGGWYGLPWDGGEVTLRIDPGAGTGTLTHKGVTYSFTAADPAATVAPAIPLTADAAYNPDAP